MKKTAIRLADGRDLFYHDVGDAPGCDQADMRDLSASLTNSEARYDPILDQWVIIASHRQQLTYKPAFNDCPLCPSRLGHDTEVPAFDYDAVVFENRFPALAMTQDDPEPERAADASLRTRPGMGRCEVVCFTAEDDTSLASLRPEHVDPTLEAWIDRTEQLSRLAGIQQVFCFENSAHEIGVTLDHPHGQIYAYPFLTPRMSRMLNSAAAHHRRSGRNLFGDRLAAEIADGSRIVMTTEFFTASVPHAARGPTKCTYTPTNMFRTSPP